MLTLTENVNVWTKKNQSFVNERFLKIVQVYVYFLKFGVDNDPNLIY